MERISQGEPRTRSGRVSATASMVGEDEPAVVPPRVVKRDPSGGGGGSSRNGTQRGRGGGGDGGGGEAQQGVTERRVLRSKYLAVKNLINDERENISAESADKFKEIFGKVENLHNQVQKPREQVADAEALLDIANTIVASVRSQNNDGITPSDFITSLLGAYSPPNGDLSTENLRQSFDWTKFGHDVSHIFMKPNGCSTMLGPMSIELKQRQRAPQRKRTRTAESSRPEELDDADAEERTDTDKNMAIMFNILRRKRSVKLEALILNRNSFAQTVENLFALSFLVKDGRVQITVDNNGHHLVAPKNAPAAAAVASGEVSYSHFVFRLDFKDWKLMLDFVRDGEELMPHRTHAPSPDGETQRETVPEESQAAAPTTPIRKLCRNRGLVIQEESVVEESPESNSVRDKAYAIRMDPCENHAHERRSKRPMRVQNGRPKRVQNCGRCREAGHNKRTCERRSSNSGVLPTRMRARRTPEQGERTNRGGRGSRGRTNEQRPTRRRNPLHPESFIDLTQSPE